MERLIEEIVGKGNRELYKRLLFISELNLDLLMYGDGNRCILLEMPGELIRIAVKEKSYVEAIFRGYGFHFQDEGDR